MQNVNVPPQVLAHPVWIFGHGVAVAAVAVGQGGGVSAGHAVPPSARQGFVVLEGQGGGVNVGHAVPPVHLGSAKQPPYICPHSLTKSAQIVGQGFVGDGESASVTGLGRADASPTRSMNGSASIVVVV